MNQNIKKRVKIFSLDLKIISDNQRNLRESQQHNVLFPSYVADKRRKYFENLE